MIPYGRQDIQQSDVDAVVEVLHSDFLTQGPKVPEFESSVARQVRCRHAVAVNSATSALHIACLALGVGEGDSVWTSPNTFVASANCARYCGASVDFVDIDPDTYNISLEALKAKLEWADKNGKLPKVVIPIHFAGQACPMAEIAALAQHYGFSVVEDASHAIGGRYQDEMIGNCSYSDITIFSFHPVKIITSAEGGMAVTNSEVIATKMRELRSHGITRDASRMTHLPDGPWYYEQLGLGFNYRMTELQAALGLSQLQRLDKYVARRHELAIRYDEKLAHLPVATPQRLRDCYSAFHLYVIQLELAQLCKSRLSVFEFLRERGIGVNVHYIPVHTQPYYKQAGFEHGDFPVAENYYSRALSLPLFPTMTIADQDMVISALTEVLT